jgi:hypothetical protein
VGGVFVDRDGSGGFDVSSNSGGLVGICGRAISEWIVVRWFFSTRIEAERRHCFANKQVEGWGPTCVAQGVSVQWLRRGRVGRYAWEREFLFSGSRNQPGRGNARTNSGYGMASAF